MTPTDLIQRQNALGWSNKRLARYCRRSEQTVSNWRNKRQAIPEYVGQLLRAAEQAKALKESGALSGFAGAAPAV